MSLKITIIYHNSWYIGLALNEQATRVTDWRRERRQKVVELKNHPQQETDGKLQFHACLMLIAQVLVLCWVQFYLPFWKKDPAMSGSELSFCHQRWHSSTGLRCEQRLQPSRPILHSGPIPQKLTMPPWIKKILLPFPELWISLTLQWLLPLVSLCPFFGPPIPSGLHW